MSESDKKIFDDYIKKYTEYHQENDAVVREGAGYYDMNDDEKAFFDKNQIQLKKDRDYYDEEFDAAVEKEMESARFKEMNEKDKLDYLNDKRDGDFSKMMDLTNNDFIDTMAAKAMDFFGISEEAQDIVQQVIGKWSGTRENVKEGIN